LLPGHALTGEQQMLVHEAATRSDRVVCIVGVAGSGKTPRESCFWWATRRSCPPSAPAASPSALRPARPARAQRQPPPARPARTRSAQPSARGRTWALRAQGRDRPPPDSARGRRREARTATPARRAALADALPNPRARRPGAIVAARAAAAAPRTRTARPRPRTVTGKAQRDVSEERPASTVRASAPRAARARPRGRPRRASCALQRPERLKCSASVGWMSPPAAATTTSLGIEPSPASAHGRAVPPCSATVDVDPRALVQQIRMLRGGNGPNIELFQCTSPDQDQTRRRNSDWGGHHVAYYVRHVDKGVDYLQTKARTPPQNMTIFTDPKTCSNRVKSPVSAPRGGVPLLSVGHMAH
jgi:hypothetical protein